MITSIPKSTLVEIAEDALGRTDRMTPVSVPRVRVLALALLEALGHPVERRSAARALNRAQEQEAEGGRHERTPSGGMRWGGSTDPEVERARRRNG